MMVVGTWRYYNRDRLQPVGISLQDLGTRFTEIFVLSIPLINIPFAGIYLYYHYKLSRRIVKAKTESGEKVRHHLEQGDGYMERERYSNAKSEYEKCTKSIEELEISSPDYLLTTAPRIRNFAIKNELKQELADDLSEAERKKEKAERIAIEYEETLSKIKKAEDILDSIKSNLEQDMKYKTIEDVYELHRIINNLPEDLSHYKATQEVQHIKERCDNLITKMS
jgi:flagellin-specific chaperone FliS